MRTGIVAGLVAVLIACGTARADGIEPETSLLPTSAKNAFPMDAYLPLEYWGVLDSRNYFAITGFYVGHRSIAAAGESLLKAPGAVCSIYDNAVCYDVGQFYRSAVPQVLVSGYYKLDGNTAINWGIDSGFSSQKLSVSPALLLGISKRWYLSERRDSQIVFEFSGWLGQSIKHSPCSDSYGREYYCGNLSAWSDFTETSRTDNFYVKLWYDWAF